ncbi:voltage-gated chloride channel family protein [Hymenobacter sediminicola]|uniref:Voltage-gated chloride channel family protein n=1 Tax=Hymenobacter sediminicola TaxID=2761579 RepID=A0A7G7W437_9BACT|nr:voltage-gated chloride channel family protein [Hymenobacter sediminicola]QNH61130.1 voltage-gated chloride channel family protein [Hymenobacter sediminicola]
MLLSTFFRHLPARLRGLESTATAVFLGRWLLFSVLVGVLAGSASAFFLVALDWATNWREQQPWVLALLPVAGMGIGLAYQYFGKQAVRGNNLILEEIDTPRAPIPLRLVPLVLGGTLATHLFGGSAGREGTAVQMGGALADQLTRLLRLRPRDRRLLLIAGMSAGFASVFGTPLAGAVFGLEVFLLGSIRYDAVLPAFLAAISADFVTRAWGVGHTQYPQLAAFPITPLGLGSTLLAGALFGLVARSFAVLTHWLSRQFGRIAYAPLRPVLGGALLVSIIWASGTTRYVGLGIPVIVEAFQLPLPPADFVWKLLLTALTLGCGFKGGEVTPLFFIGAALGSALAVVLPLPVALLAAMGFVGVFAGAANTPLACLLMGLELFGVQGAVYLALACVVAYLFSGHRGIYGAQVIGQAKHPRYGRHQGKRLNEL